MSDGLIRLTVVTDSAERASLALFGFRLRAAALEAPWCRFVDRTQLFATIPDHAPVMALWFDVDPLMDIRWFNERHKRPFKDDWCEQAGRVSDWLARREARELELIASVEPAGKVQPAAQAPTPMPPLSAPSQSQPRTMWS